MVCNHEWEGIPQTRIYNPNGEYVEGYGWNQVIIDAEPTQFRCEKCKTLKVIDCEGEIFFYPPKLNPFGG